MKMMNLFSCSVIAIAIITSKGKGGTVTYYGEVANAGASASLVYGTDGYDLYATHPVGSSGGDGSFTPFGSGTRLTSLPAYVSSIFSPTGGESTGAFTNYANIDNPAGG